MPGIVVGTGRSASSAGAVRWALEAGRLREVPVTLLHAWDVPVEVEVEVAAAPRSGPLGWSASRAVTGAPAAVLLSARADVVVLGLAGGSRRPPRLVRAVLRHACVPVVVVPQGWRPREGPVVVGLCGTSASAGALRWAACEASRRRVDLVAVHAWHGSLARVREPLHLAVPAGGSDVRDQARGWVCRTLGPQQVALQLCRGPRLEALLDGASRADLLVLGSGAHSALGRLLTGTVGDDVVAFAGCPVAVVPDRPAAWAGRSGPVPPSGSQ